MKWWKKLCARPPPQPPPVPLKRGPRKGKGEEETKSTTITDTNIWFGLEHLCSTGITHDGDGGIPLFYATTRGVQTYRMMHMVGFGHSSLTRRIRDRAMESLSGLWSTWPYYTIWKQSSLWHSTPLVRYGPSSTEWTKSKIWSTN